MSFDWSKISMLIVDDDIDLRDILCDIFTRLGAKTYGALSGEEALEQLEINKVSLILSDLQMPFMDGAELLSVMNNRKMHIPFVFITGQVHFTEAKAAELGAQALVYKPYNLKGLVAKIESVLVSYSSTNQNKN